MHDAHSIFVKVVEIASQILHYRIVSIADSPVQLSNLLMALLLVSFWFKYSKKIKEFVTRNLEKNFDDPDTSQLVTRAVNGLIFVCFAVFILQVANVPLGAFAFVGGSIAIAVGLGVKNIVRNIMSGFIMVLEKPIKVGDIIQIKDYMGEVKQVYGMRSVIRLDTGASVMVPNNILAQNALINFTSENNKFAIKLDISIEKIDSDKNPIDPKVVLEEIWQVLAHENLKPMVFNSRVFLVEISSRYKYVVVYHIAISSIRDLNSSIKHIMNMELNDKLSKHSQDFSILHQIHQTINLTEQNEPDYS